jgi:hypothetical protein
MVTYDNNLKVREALNVYFSLYHFENGGYDLKWFRIKIGKLYIPLPNTKSRIKAVRIHDIHHILTGYEANLKGEAEIAGWEIASGCGKYHTAWLLNAGSFFYGLIFFPKALFTAFLKGRACRTNLYHHTTYDESCWRQGWVSCVKEPEFQERGPKMASAFLLPVPYLS